MVGDGAKVVVDLRSDTTTRPTAEMYAAMQSARVGDDVFGDDPTVSELEALASTIFEKEAALFVPTGTMSNLIAIMTHCQTGGSPFSEMIVGHKQHTYLYEVGNVARIAGVHSWVLQNKADGTMCLNEIEQAIRIPDVHYPRTKLVSLENTHNSCGGIPLSSEYVNQVGALARQHNLRVHVDGARIFNASTALGEPVSKLCAAADSISCCLSKGLGSPAGSVLIGSKAFIHQARVARKALGGGMRQAGILAACGLVSLRVMSKRLNDDHFNAQRLAKGLAEIPGIKVDPSKVKTNILFFDVEKDKSGELVENLKRDFGVLVGAYSSKTVRMVTHYDVKDSHVDYVLDAFRLCAKKL